MLLGVFGTILCYLLVFSVITRSDALLRIFKVQLGVYAGVMAYYWVLGTDHILISHVFSVFTV